MESRLYTTADYTTLKSWWQGRWGDAPSIHALPQTGVIISNDERDLAAGWLYLDMTSPVGLIAWIVTSPENSSTESKRALCAVIDGLKEIAKSQGRVHVIAACPEGSLANLFEECGFTGRDKNIEHLGIQL